jgi:hypothetical protein
VSHSGEFTGGVIINANPPTDTIYMLGPAYVINIPLNPNNHKPEDGATS